MRFERLDLNLLVALDALLEEQSVSNAAKRVFLTQPAMSGSLNRLREFFNDDLLVNTGRAMVLTPKAEELRVPVRDILMQIRTRITTPADFDPSKDQRSFIIIASDFVYNVVLAPMFAEAAVQAPNISFDVRNTGRTGQELMDRGEADLMITITGFFGDGHPRRKLFTDQHAVIAWSGGKYGSSLTEEQFFAARHAVVLFGGERHPAFSETHFASQGIKREIDVRVPTFSALPPAVIGTDRIATMYRLHAEYFAQFLPISIHEPPISMPYVTEEVQWHSLRSNDPGLKWALDLLVRHSERLARTPARRPQPD